MQLTYLFSGEYTDGTSFTQNAEDVSTSDPTKSCFYDVLNSGKTVKTFTLREMEYFIGHEGEPRSQPKLDGRTLSVDLTTGMFTLNGVSFVSESDKPLPIAKDLRLIYYRQHRHHFNRATREELGHEVTYFVGWQCTVNGKNYQQVIGIT